MKFITLTTVTGAKVRINFAHVIQYDRTQGQGYTTVETLKDFLEVTETPEEIDRYARAFDPNTTWFTRHV